MSQFGLQTRVIFLQYLGEFGWAVLFVRLLSSVVRPSVAIDRSVPALAAAARPFSLGPTAGLFQYGPVRRRLFTSYLVDPASSICLSQRLSHACLSTSR